MLPCCNNAAFVLFCGCSLLSLSFLSRDGYIVNVSGHILGHARDRGHPDGKGGGLTRGAAAGATVAADPGPVATGTAEASPRVPARAPEGQGHDLLGRDRRASPVDRD